MRLSALSLRTGICAILILILICTMILLDIVMIKTTERSMVKQEINRGSVLLGMIEQTLYSSCDVQQYDDLDASSFLSCHLQELMDVTHISMAIIENSGNIIFESNIKDADRKLFLALAKKSLVNAGDSIFISGVSWSILPLKHGDLFMARPLQQKSKVTGAVSVKIPLQATYKAIKESQKIIFFYILLNTVFFTFLGFYLLYRNILHPINQLSKRAEEFKEGEPFLLIPDTEQNEFGKLSRALNLMLRRLEDNKMKLKESLNSLEKTNIQLQQAQEEIIRSEKLASVGRLASGIAHEIGNPIGIVLGYLELLKNAHLSKKEKDDFISRIEDEVSRINRTIRSLLDFSRPSKAEAKPVSVREVLAETLEILGSHLSKAGIKATLDKSSSRDTVLADTDKIRQVFVNIVMNAIDAVETKNLVMKTSGKLLNVRVFLLSETTSEIDPENDRILIEFADTGIGISAENLSRVFDPFYTTKEPGKGTGLGLSVSLRIVEDVGGKIKVKSEEGMGTTITVILPLYNDCK